MRLIDADKLQDELLQELESTNHKQDIERIYEGKDNALLMMRQASIYYTLMLLTLAETVDVKPERQPASADAYKEVFDDLFFFDFYKGIFGDRDFKDDDPRSYMNGVRHVMGSLALEQSIEAMLEFQRVFDENLDKSLERREKNSGADQKA